MIDGVDEDRIRRYLERQEEISVAAVLGKFNLPPSAADEVVALFGESPDVRRKAARPSGQDLYRQPITTPLEGGGGYPSPPSDGGVIGPYNGSEAEGGEK